MRHETKAARVIVPGDLVRECECRQVYPIQPPFRLGAMPGFPKRLFAPAPTSRWQWQPQRQLPPKPRGRLAHLSDPRLNYHFLIGFRQALGSTKTTFCSQYRLQVSVFTVSPCLLYATPRGKVCRTSHKKLWGEKKQRCQFHCFLWLLSAYFEAAFTRKSVDRNAAIDLFH